MYLPNESKNWFTPAEKDNNSRCYNYNEFCTQLQIQIKRKLNIDNNNKCLKLKDSYYFQELRVIIEEHNFKEFDETVLVLL